MSLTMKELDHPAAEHPVAFVSGNLFSEFEKLFRSYVARRAFALYEESGRPKGKDWQHWLQAESEYLFARPKVLESHDRISLFAIVPEKPARGIQICIAPLGVIIKTKLLRLDAERSYPTKGNPLPEQFLLARWTKRVDPDGADATLDGSLLRLTAWKVTTQDSHPAAGAGATRYETTACLQEAHSGTCSKR
jgi:hypothetical protein